jgi:nicotinamide phosphoribosyltransferase
MSAPPMLDRTTNITPSSRNNIMLMTDGYKFSHHKQFPLSWVPEHVRPTGTPEGYEPPILFPAKDGRTGSIVHKLAPVPGVGEKSITIVTGFATAVVKIAAADAGDSADLTYSGAPIEFTGAVKSTVVIELSTEVLAMLGLSSEFTKIKISNIDESKLKRGSQLNDTFEGGFNVSYFTPRGYKDQFDGLADEGNGDHIVFFGLQYLVKEYLTGEVVTTEKIDEADAFIARYMADVRVAGPEFEKGYDYTLFPRGDWMSMVTGDYEGTGTPNPELAGVLPIKIEALPEGSLLSPGVCCFKLTNTHPRFFWLPNFLETLLVQVR